MHVPGPEDEPAHEIKAVSDGAQSALRRVTELVIGPGHVHGRVLVRVLLLVLASRPTIRKCYRPRPPA